MKYLKFFLLKIKKTIKGILKSALPFWFYILIFLVIIASEGYTLEDFRV